MIEDIYNNSGTDVFLFTRPRRFGKTLTMNMLSSFHDISKDSRDIFSGLDISRNKEICDKWMNKFPTVFVSFKDIDGLTFDSAAHMLSSVMSELYEHYLFLEESDNISEEIK